MGILLLLISSVFALLFFLFSGEERDSFFGTPLLGATLFLFFGIIFFFFFSGFGYEKKSQIASLNLKTLGKIVKIFFQKYLYYIGFILFYLAAYLFLQGLGIEHISPVVLLVNIIILGAFFLNKAFFILQDFIKVNTILFSLLYIYWYLLILIFGDNFFTILDFINTGMIFLNFGICLRFEKLFLKKQYLDTSFLAYFSLYSSLSFIFYLSYIFDSLSFIISLIGIGGCFLLFILSENIESLKKSRKTLKTIGLFLMYIGSISAIIGLFSEELPGFLWILLLGAGTFNFFVHKYYQNYVSFVLSFVIFFSLSLYTFFHLPLLESQKNILILSLFGGVSFCMILMSYFFKMKYIYDYYLFHIFAYIVNLFGVFSFFYFAGFDILAGAIILFMESIFVFLSYYKLNSLRKGTGNT